MKPIQQWIDEYGESHQNPTNKLIHWVCVPLIMLSLLALIGKIPFFINGLTLFTISSEPVLFDWTIIFLSFCIIFYSRLSLTLSLGMLLIAICMFIGGRQPMAFLWENWIFSQAIPIRAFMVLWKFSIRIGSVSNRLLGRMGRLRTRLGGARMDLFAWRIASSSCWILGLIDLCTM